MIIYDTNSEKKETITITQRVPPTGYIDGHEYVDLGLPSGTLWATMNVGATDKSDWGTFVAWGETEGATCIDRSQFTWIGKLDFTIENYKYYKSTTETSNEGEFTETKTYEGFTKYVFETNGYKGFTDNKKTLDSEDDLATTSWGNNWRTPTANELYELTQYCEFIYGEINNRTGYKVSGPNGNWIFLSEAASLDGKSRYLPGTGQIPSRIGTGTWYWSSDLVSDYSPNVLCIFGDSPAYVSSFGRYRYVGLPVRPVVNIPVANN